MLSSPLLSVQPVHHTTNYLNNSTSLCSFIPCRRPSAGKGGLGEDDYLVMLSEVRKFQPALTTGTVFVPASAVVSTRRHGNCSSRFSERELSQFLPAFLYSCNPLLTASSISMNHSSPVWSSRVPAIGTTDDVVVGAPQKVSFSTS